MSGGKGGRPSGARGGSGGEGGRGYPRSHRVGDFIQREIAQLVRTEVKDPRLSPLLTVSAVDVSRDLSVATVHWTTLDSEGREETQEALNSAAPFLRRRLAPLINIRAVPELRFRHDDSIERGARMSALIDRAVDSNTTAAEVTEPVDETGSDPLADAVPDPLAAASTDPLADPDRRPGTDPLADG